MKGVRLDGDDAGTATGTLVLAAEAPRANTCPWQGPMDPSHTKGTRCGATGLAWRQGEGCCSSWGTTSSFVLGKSGRDHSVSVGMDRGRLQQWLFTGVDTSD